MSGQRAVLAEQRAVGGVDVEDGRRERAVLVEWMSKTGGERERLTEREERD